MRRFYQKTLFLITASAVLLFFSTGSGQTSMEFYTICTAGGSAQSSGHQVFATVGQPVQIATIASAQHTIYGHLITTSAYWEAPVIDPPDPFTTPPGAGQDIQLSATITDNINVDNATLNYRQGGETQFQSLAMTQNGNVFTASIPAASVGSRGVEYYITAVDVHNNTSQSDLFSIQVSLAGEGIEKEQAQPAGEAQNAYRLISIPINATNKGPAAVLVDDLDEYDNTKWRFYELRADQEYYEYQNAGNMTPGKAFWLIVKDANKTIDTGPGVTIETVEPYEISLAQGWTFIGNPFNFNIPLENVTLEDGSTLDIRAYDGSWDTFSGSLTPFAGYAVYAEAATNLLVDPLLSGVGKKQIPKITTNDDENAWSIGIKARCQKARDVDTKAMIMEKAAAEYDQFDRPEPPVIGEFVSVYFPHPEWEKVSSNYCADVRQKIEDGDIWEFEVRTNIRDMVQLHFNGMESVPEEYEIWVVDKALKLVQNVRESDVFETSVSLEQPKNLLLMVGNSEYIAEKFEEFDIIPSKFVLFQNFPNPFNPTTTIRFGLPADQKVSLKIYNTIGQEITTLIDKEQKNAGYHVITWDGKNSQGENVASGMYIFYLKSGKQADVKKMILIR